MNKVSEMTTGRNSLLKSFQKSGKSQDIANMAGSICSVLNYQAELIDEQDSGVLAEKRKKV